MAKSTQTKNRTTKHQPAATAPAGTRHAQDSMNRLYVAHQVHTLANMLFHHIALAGQDSWSCGTGVRASQQPAPTFGYGGPWNTAPWQPASAPLPGVSQPLLYWYP
jgi:hypothetical protein